MKLVTLLALSIVSTAALAMPKVGDQALYDLTISKDAQVMQGTLESEITAQDAASGMLTVNRKFTINGNAQSQQEQVQPNDLPSDGVISQMLVSCETTGGTSESVTVPAGTFPTCAIKYNDNGRNGTAWVAAVPFGMVKNESVGQDGTNVSLTLKSYKLGQ